MFISGLWHGAGWTFALWGLFYGVLIVIYQAIGMGGAWKPANKLTGFAAWLVMFIFIVLSFAIFRTPTLGWLFGVFTRSPLIGSPDYQAAAFVTLSMTAFYAAPLIMKMLMDRHLKPDSIWHVLYYAAATVVMLAYLNSSAPDFIYFQF
jgi:D-alanyl-lipoteichoic acid acyltransferase DltB (MBOAT superfamily)